MIVAFQYKGHKILEAWDVVDDELFDTLKTQFQSLLPYGE